MALSTVFKDKLTRALKLKLKKYTIEAIKCEHEKIICGDSSIFFDCRVKIGLHNIEILIEIESHRPDPSHNLLKTLIWLDENNPCDPVILLHVFDVAYIVDDKLQKKMCEFTYNKVKLNYRKFSYRPLNISGLADCDRLPYDLIVMKAACSKISDTATKLVEAQKVKLRSN